ncbi:MAG: lipid II flippase MurJ, partial [Candidatus Cloacimonadota bacterium]|nr:lipid II flippase MurJ [Candidatus Cloacimonadota bacterium]
SSGLIFFSINRILVSIFYANKDTKTPLKITSFIVVINIILNVILMQFFAHAGLAMATVVSSIIQLIILVVHIKKQIPEIKKLQLFPSIIKISFITLIIGFILYLADSHFQSTSIIYLIIKDSIFIGFSFLTIFILSFVLKVEYSNNFRNFVWSKISRRK